jgi:hypothetical protein
MTSFAAMIHPALIVWVNSRLSRWVGFWALAPVTNFVTVMVHDTVADNLERCPNS